MKYISFLLFSLLLVSCGGDEIDYRDQFLGTYDATKSTRSFDDSMPLDADDILVEISNSSDSTIIVDGVKLPLKEDGTTGRIIVNDQVYDLSFQNDSLRLFTHPNAIGFFPYCYIKGFKK